jgi:hypothetical protein
MKYDHVTLVVLTVVVHIACTSLPTLTHGLELIDASKSGIDKNSSDDDDRDVPLKQGHLDMESLLTRRLLEGNATCSNACESTQLNRLRTSFAKSEVNEEADDEGNVGVVGRLFGRITGFSGAR